MTTSCEAHHKPLNFYCFDKTCKQTPLCCVICVKNLHNKCENNLLMEKEGVEERIQIMEKEVDP